jgi:prepilin-type N-terminal cleavage/methylation domain-containing protein
MVRYRRRSGFSLIELLIVIAIILVIVAVALPRANQVIMSGNESAALREIGTLHQAQLQYYSQFNRYAGSLAELGPPASGAAGPAAADLIPSSLAEGRKSGYVFTLTKTATGYAINANPETFGSSGRKTYYSDQTLVIRANNSQEPASVTSPEIGAAQK